MTVATRSQQAVGSRQKTRRESKSKAKVQKAKVEDRNPYNRTRGKEAWPCSLVIAYCRAYRSLPFADCLLPAVFYIPL